jgi:hypothetical protein
MFKVKIPDLVIMISKRFLCNSDTYQGAAHVAHERSVQWFGGAEHLLRLTPQSLQGLLK